MSCKYLPIKAYAEIGVIYRLAGTDGGPRLIGGMNTSPAHAWPLQRKTLFAERAPLPLQIINLQTGSQNNDRGRPLIVTQRFNIDIFVLRICAASREY